MLMWNLDDLVLDLKYELSGKNCEIKDALLFLMPNYFEGCHATAVRIGKGDRKLSLLDGFANSLVMYWMSGNSYEYHFAEFPGTQVDFRDLVGEKYPNVRYLQLLLVSEDHFPVAPPV